MSISAKEAHNISVSTREERTAKIIGKIDSMIDQAIYEGKFTVTSPIMCKDDAEVIYEHYTDLGYEVIDYNNNMVGINW